MKATAKTCYGSITGERYYCLDVNGFTLRMSESDYHRMNGEDPNQSGPKLFFESLALILNDRSNGNEQSGRID